MGDRAVGWEYHWRLNFVYVKSICVFGDINYCVEGSVLGLGQVGRATNDQGHLLRVDLSSPLCCDVHVKLVFSIHSVILGCD